MQTPVKTPTQFDSTLPTYYLSRDKRRCGLRVLNVADQSVHGVPQGRLLNVAGREDASRLSTLVTTAARGFFEMTAFELNMLGGQRAGRQKTVSVLPTVFEDEMDRRVRVTYKELVIRFKHQVNGARRKQLLDKFGFVTLEKSSLVADQEIVSQPTVKYAGESLVAVANELTLLDEVVFATPNFVSEFRRQALPIPRSEQWHLAAGKAGSAAVRAWSATTGSSAIGIAVLDDGVDLTHPDLKGRIKGKLGRDFFVAPDSPDHLDPSPKRSQFPFDQMQGNDIHGTPCAGVALADGKAGKRVFGAAPGCQLLPIKVFHGDALATDSRVAAAIRYAAKHARVLSCSWSGPQSPDLEFALEDIGAEHGGRGAVVCAASGNDSAHQVAFPAADPNVIGVGAMTDQGSRADYSNFGPELSVVAPSGGGTRDIFTTDVSFPNRGFNLGTEVPGDTKGRYTSSFSGTSSATPLAAGVCALILSRNSKLTRAEVRTVLQETARKVGNLAYVDGRNDEHGFGCVDAGAALDHILVAGAKPKPKAKASKKGKKKSKKAKKAK